MGQGKDRCQSVMFRGVGTIFDFFLSKQNYYLC
jgi:hypothetical protein